MARVAKKPRTALPSGPEEKIRVTLDLPRTFNERLEELGAKTYLGNKAAVIRHALQVYEYLVRTTEEGGSIVIRTPEGQERHLDRLSLAVAN